MSLDMNILRIFSTVAYFILSGNGLFDRSCLPRDELVVYK
jgi:hypothetical protein